MRVALSFLVVLAIVVPARAEYLMSPTVNNGSFEDPAVTTPDGHVAGGTYSWKFATPNGWTFTQYGNMGTIDIGCDGTAGTLNIISPDGHQHAGITTAGFLSETVGVFQANTIYTLNGWGTRELTDTSNPQLCLGNASVGVVSDLPTPAESMVFMSFPTLTINTQLNPSYVGTDIMVVARNVTLSGSSYFDNFTLTATAVPEPGTVVLLTTGIVALLAYVWRKRK